MSFLKKWKTWQHYQNFKIIDSFVEGDYEFYLLLYYETYHDKENKHNDSWDFYQIGMQKTGKSFVDVDQQMKKEPSTRGKGSIENIKQKINEWLAKCHRIYFGSMNKRKTETWLRILKRLGYKIRKDPAINWGTYYIEEWKRQPKPKLPVKEKG